MTAAALICLPAAHLRAQNPESKDYAVAVSAINTPTQSAKFTVRLTWPKSNFGEGYDIYRRKRGVSSWGATIGTATADATFFDVPGESVEGTAFEYKVVRKKVDKKYNGYGYILVGEKMYPNFPDRGTILIMIDDTLAGPLKTEIARLKQDLELEGWFVSTYTEKRADKRTPAMVKETIKGVYNKDKNLKALLLLGHIPVPYSGDVNIDGHEDHKGAWPCDIYYGELAGEWTDFIVEDESPARLANHNVPDDGKFDNSILPADVTLQVGRVDMSNLPAFKDNEIELTRRYLNKNHAFRSFAFQPRARGLVTDKFGPMGGEAFAAGAYKAFAPMFGADSIVASGDFINEVRNGSFLFSYGTGPGSYNNVGGVITTSHYADKPAYSVFNMAFGSYFGDWDNTNNVLRAALAGEGYALTNSWSGRPHWIYHHMAMGETVGYSTMKSMNDYGSYFRFILYTDTLVRLVSPALMGDPTLKLFVPASAPISASAEAANSRANITFTQPADWKGKVDQVVLRRRQPGSRSFKNIVFKAPDEPWDEPQENFIYDEQLPVKGTYTYMLYGRSLQHTASGSYYNYTPGISFTVDITQVGIAGQPQHKALTGIYPQPAANMVNINIPETGETLELAMADASGRILKQMKLRAEGQTLAMETQDLAPGFYTLTLTGSSGIYTGKVCIAR